MIPVSVLTHSALEQIANALLLDVRSIGRRAVEWRLLSGDAAVLGDAILDTTGGVFPVLPEHPTTLTGSNLRLWFSWAAPKASNMVYPPRHQDAGYEGYIVVAGEYEYSIRLSFGSSVPTPEENMTYWHAVYTITYSDNPYQLNNFSMVEGPEQKQALARCQVLQILSTLEILPPWVLGS